MTMMTATEIKQHVRKHHRGLRPQVGVHGAWQGCLQLFRDRQLVVDISLRTTSWGSGPFRVTAEQLDAAIRRALARLAEEVLNPEPIDDAVEASRFAAEAEALCPSREDLDLSWRMAHDLD